MSFLSKAAREGSVKKTHIVEDPIVRKARHFMMKVRKARDLYYNDANDGPDAISDTEYDRLVEELERLAPQLNKTVQAELDNALNAVGAEEVGPFAKVPHLVPMLSLEKELDIEALKQWMGGSKVVTTPKLDGLSLSIHYENGQLIQAVTRGDGKVGADVTPNVREIRDVPLEIPFKDKLEVRGEVVMRKERFATLCREAELKGEEKPKSARNLAAGSLRQLDPQITAQRKLNFRAYRVIYHDTIPGNVPDISFWEDLQWLRRMNFRVPLFNLVEDTGTLEELIHDWEKNKEVYEFDIDGLVICYDSKRKHELLGEGRKAPKYAKAFKWEAEKGVTTLIGVEWSTGKTGRVVPTGLVEPIELSGATVQRVTLHNYSTLVDHKLRPGDKIHIQRSGEVIPKFLGVASRGELLNNQHLIVNCPSCSTPLINSGVDLVCPNSSCIAQAQSRVIHYVQTVKMDGIGKGIIEKMFEAGIIQSAADLYRVKQEDIARLPNMGKRSIQLALEAIQSRRTVKYPVFLAALGCRGISGGTSEKLTEKFPSVDELLNASISDIEQLDGFAYTSAQEVFTSLQDAKELIRDLLGEIELEIPKQASDILANKTFVITGSMSRSRNEIKEFIQTNGGQVQSSVSGKTQYLVAGDNVGGTKLKAAEKHNTTIISEEDLFGMVV